MARVAAPAGTWTRPDPLAPATSAPRFPEPMFDGLQRMAPWLFLPGVENVEADGVALLETTPRVIEAYMAGLNHELSRELLWREFPAALTGTAFRQFWDVSGQPGDAEALADIPPIAEWAGTPLGGHVRGGGGQLVLLVRGELLRRYPTTTIYAARATAAGALDATTRLAPMFRAALPPDIVLVGFGLSEESAPGRPRRAGTSSSSSTRASRGSGSTRSPPPASRARRTRWPGRTCRSRRPATPTSSKPLLSAAAGLQAAVGQERGQHGVADLPAAVPDRDARVAPDRPERRMTDLAAIAAARATGLAAEADALALADRLVAAKADRARLRADLAQLPGRIAALQQAVAEAQARVAAATQSRDALNAQASAARAAAAAADSAAAAADEAGATRRVRS